MLNEKRTVGRPKTRGNEAAMFVIWRMVQTEIHAHGANGVSEACRRLATRSIRFDWGDDDRKKEHVYNEKTLRRRYYDADKARQDVMAYPMLHKRCANLEADFPAIAGRQKEMNEYVAAVKAKGYDPEAVNGIGAVPHELRAIHEKYVFTDENKPS
jgi:hypothetical protein